MSKKSILFVDDEINILNGLRRLLFSMISEWDMHFVTSGADALTFLESNPVDLLVSDMRMPQMNGVQLLEKVKEKYPHIIRFILSGHSDQDLIIQSLQNTDKFLTKPCSADDLITAIYQALTSIRNPQNPLQAIISKMDSLPTMPDLYSKLQEMIESPSVSIKEIADIISQDMGMSAKILHLVNSSFFALKRSVKNIQEAVTYLGFNTIKAIILTTHLFDQFSDNEIQRFNIKVLYRHSFIVSQIATLMMNDLQVDSSLIENATIAGLLHDLGKIIFIRNYPDEYIKIYHQSPLYTFEIDKFGSSHAEIGGYWMKIWGLKPEIINTIYFHHQPSQAGNLPIERKKILLAIHVANFLDLEKSIDSEEALMAYADQAFVKQMAVSHLIPKWIELAQDFRQHDIAIP